MRNKIDHKKRFDALMASLYKEGFTKVSITRRLLESGYDITYSRLVNLERCKAHYECKYVADQLEKVFAVEVAEEG